MTIHSKVSVKATGLGAKHTQNCHHAKQCYFGCTGLAAKHRLRCYYAKQCYSRCNMG